MEDDAFKTTWK